jgi:hypothetical protein
MKVFINGVDSGATVAYDQQVQPRSRPVDAVTVPSGASVTFYAKTTSQPQLPTPNSKHRQLT